MNETCIDIMLAHSSGHISKVCVISKMDGHVLSTNYAEATRFNVSAEEARAVARVIKVGNLFSMCQDGVTLEGHKYVFVKDLYEDGRAYVVKKGGHGTVTMECSETVIIMAFVPPDKRPEAAVPAVSLIADGLRGKGF